ncbi:MAG: acetyl-CoA C-acyltransferase, partial [Gammaproteobacteria bacterium]
MSLIQDAYIVAALRTPVGKAPRGMFCRTRPDDLLVHVLKGVVGACPEL